MKYKNASEVFPEELLEQVQQYAAGELIYIPLKNPRSAWGSRSGAKSFYEQRNREIIDRHYKENASVRELADQYGLSESTVRRILYD